jgi:hypothetical protein
MPIEIPEAPCDPVWRKQAEEHVKRLSKAFGPNLKKVEMMEAAHFDRRYKKMADILPVAKEGSAEITHFTISSEDSEWMRLRAMVTTYVLEWISYVPPGDYTRLVIDGRVFMSDTAHEKLSSLPLLNRAHGNVLVSGLGIGMVLPPLLANPLVDSVVVIENNADVIKLVGSHFEDTKLEIVLGDVWTWKPHRRELFDVIFHDIWPSIDSENLDDMNRLKRRYRRWMRKSKSRWQWCWAEDICREMNREYRRQKEELRLLQASLGGDPLQGLV